ncbi:MAG: hypothetical protein FJX72_16075, partial [Armatimonadetes bacterium]|nr:hypothetical protein [Armatimonadota bacterium]
MLRALYCNAHARPDTRPTSPGSSRVWRLLPARVCATAGLLCLLRPGYGDIAVAGDRLTIRTANIRVVMRAGEVVEITNRLTGERIATGIGRLEPHTVMLRVKGVVGPMRCDGWRTAHEDDAQRQAAQTVLRDGSATVWLNVSVDQDTQDVVVAAWAESLTEGVRGLRLAVRSLDLSVGRLIVPSQKGIVYGLKDAEPPAPVAYPSDWVAQMLVWQSAQGGVVVYSRDDEARYKTLHVSRRGERVDLGLVTEAEAPWATQSSVPHLEWRFNAYRGDWRVPATGYRSLVSFIRTRSKPTDQQLWVGQITGVEVVRAGSPDAVLEQAAKLRPPARTLLYVPDWGTGKRPDRALTGWDARFISRAHEMGFYVLLPVDVALADPEWDGFARVARLQVRGPSSGERPVDRDGIAVMNGASAEWRRALIRALRGAFDGAAPDALLVRDACSIPNDGTGQIEGRTAAEGMVALLRDVQRAFPSMVLASEGISELIWPNVRIARRPTAHAPEGTALTA